MLAEIGIMVGFYIMTRMLALERKKDGTLPMFARVLAIVTFIITAIVVVDLVYRGFSASNNMPSLPSF